MKTSPHANAQEKLLNEMALKGLPLHEPLKLDGLLHRYGKRGPNDAKDEWYRASLLENGEICCTFGSWSGEQEHYNFRSWEDTSPYVELFREESRKLLEKHIEEEKRLCAEALKKARLTLEKSTAASDNHEYLTRKKVSAHPGVTQLNGALLIPRRDITGELASIQSILPSGEKKNFPGLPCKSTFFVLGETEHPKTIRFCEGYATGATIFEHTGDMTVVCFSCGNIFGTTFLFREKFPRASLVLNADRKTEKLCEKWKSQYKGEVQVPTDLEGTDFNDLYIEKGPKECLKQLQLDDLEVLGLRDFLETDFPKRNSILYESFSGKNSPILLEGTSTLVFASGGVGKTNFLYEFSVAVSYGQQFLYYKVTRPYKVFYIDSEMDPSIAQERFSEIAIRRELTECNENFSYYNLGAENLKKNFRRTINLYCPNSRNLLNKHIEKNDIIIIDNLQNTTRDLQNEGKENSSSAWTQIHDWMKEWQSKGKTFLIAHHENRSGTYRGTSRLDGDFDNIFHLTRPEEAPEEGFKFIFEIQKGRQILQQFQHVKTAFHKKPGHIKCFGWEFSSVT